MHLILFLTSANGYYELTQPGLLPDLTHTIAGSYCNLALSVLLPVLIVAFDSCIHLQGLRLDRGIPQAPPSYQFSHILILFCVNQNVVILPELKA